MDKYRTLLDQRAEMLEQKRAGLTPARAVFTEALTNSGPQSKEALTRQLFAEDQVQQIFAQLDQVRDARQRIIGGSYGLCSLCGEPIGASRLQLLPETPNCLSCQSGAEQGW